MIEPIRNYKIIKQNYPLITIEDFNQHLKYDFQDLKIFQDSSYIAGLYSTTQVYGEVLVGYTDNLRIAIELSETNIGDITINISNIGVKKLFTTDGTSQVPASFIIPNQRYYIEYSNTLDGGSGAFKLTSKNSDENMSGYAFNTIQSSINYIENFTKLTINRNTFEINFFENETLNLVALRKSPYIQVNSITIDGSDYDLNNVEIDNSIYPFAIINFDNKQIENAVINFDAGFTIESFKNNYGLKNSILELTGFLYSNRGDCNVSKLSDYICKLLKGFCILNI